MTSLTLHHYEMSPFSEKVRRMLAFKGLPWQAVRVPAVMPKPDVLALTGGYRKTPVLQEGNHVFCDTSLIARVLERKVPTPTLYPTPLAQTFAEWADTALFECTVSVAMRPTRFDDFLRYMTEAEMNGFVEDRRAMGTDARRAPPPGKVAKTLLQVYFARIDAALATQAYVLGAVPSVADFSVYHCAWFVRSLAPEQLAAFPNVLRWMEPIAALPDAAITPITSEDALNACKQSNPEWQAGYEFADPMGLAQGQRVIVRALDYGRDPVEGELAASCLDEVVLRREDPRAGTVFVHFPRVGYEISAVK
jgi:glutathione S-transferase